MSRSSGRKSRRQQLDASHQKNWLTGLHAIHETLTAGVWPADKLYLEDAEGDSGDLDDLARLASDVSLDVIRVSRERITELCHSRHHQGAAARMGTFPYRDMGFLEQALSDDGEHSLPACVVVCDRIMDAHNFGAILRCCDAMKVTAIVIGETEQVGVTPHVARASSGAVNYVPIARVADLTSTCRTLGTLGLALAAASEKSEGEVWTADLNRPLTLVIGNEARGVSSELLNLCELHLRIPMMGQGESLNAAVAAGTLLYEIRRQHAQS